MPHPLAKDLQLPRHRQGMNDASLDDVEPRLRRTASAPAAPELDAALVTGAPERRAPRLVRHGHAIRAASISMAAVAAVSVGALVIPGIVAPRAPLFAVGGGTNGPADSEAASAAQIGVWVDYRYLAGDTLATSGGSGNVYELTRQGTPHSVLSDIAAALGLPGAATTSQYSSNDYPSYVIGPEDGSAAMLSLSWSGAGDWWYSDPAAYPEPDCPNMTVTNEDGTDGSYQDCQIPTVPAARSQAPDAAEARERAAALFAATGLDVAEGDIRVTVDEWQTLASANLEVGGVVTALEWSVSWSPLGMISWASGHAVEVVERGAFDTVSPVEAVERLDDGRWFGAAGPGYGGGAVAFAASDAASDVAHGAQPGTGVDAVESPLRTPEGEPVLDSAPAVSDPDTPSSSDPAPLDPAPAPLPEPLPEPDPMPSPETVTVTLEHAEATLLMLWDVDGNAWLVPGYAFTQPDHGFWAAVVSLVEGVIQLPEPFDAATDATIEPMPADATP